MTREAVLALIALAVLAAGAGCGVSSQDTPKPIEGTSTNLPPATPSVDIDPSPTSATTSSPRTSPVSEAREAPDGQPRPSAPAG